MTELPLALREVSISRELEKFSSEEVARVAYAPIGETFSRLARRDFRQRSPLLFDDR
jgi:DNA-directed RNA polymerase specialized sigma24 family protein